MNPSDKLYSHLKNNNSSKIWRNAYYLSTSIEEDIQRQPNYDKFSFVPTSATKVDYKAFDPAQTAPNLPQNMLIPTRKDSQ